MRLRRPALVALCSLSGACASWQQTNPADLHGAHPVRVETASQRLRFDRAHVRGDTLIGEFGDPPREAAVPLTDVRRIEERKISASRSVGLLAGTAGVVVIGGIVVILSVLAGNN
jgi:hypothetical protein